MAFDRSEQARRNFTTHGLTTTSEGTKIYNAWLDIKRKCYDTEAREYCRYGAKGRTLADVWLTNPVAFVDYMLSLPNFSMGMTIDRIDNELGYLQGNLRWATYKQQAHNRGKVSTNVSGYNGVAFRVVTSNTYATAQWRTFENKVGNKAFSVNKLGLLPAFAKACAYRDAMIVQLNEQGAFYSDKHGK